jgi:membrane-bound lytic murein transglycosylase D
MAMTGNFFPGVVFLRCLSLTILLLIPGCGEKRLGIIYIPDTLLFAGDTIPLQEPEIRERLERELRINQYWQASTIQWLRRSQRWFPLFDSLLTLHGLPCDLRYLVAIESGFENVSSHRGAAGFWQLMEPTALEFGLIINNEIDERLDPEKSGIAACRQLQRGYAEFKSWPATAVSYNIGVNGLKSVMQAQHTNSFFDLIINQESARYLFRILAAKLILENPEKYGYERLEPFPAYQWKNLRVTDSIPDLPWWCRKRGISYKCFRILNPWIKGLSLHLPAGKQHIEVRIPLDCRVFTKIELPDAPAADSMVLRMGDVGQHLINQKDMKGLRGAAGDMLQIPKKFHLVNRGENLSTIAQMFNLSVSDLNRLNPELAGTNGLREGFSLRLLPD